jgi:hypothetical protein
MIRLKKTTKITFLFLYLILNSYQLQATPEWETWDSHSQQAYPWYTPEFLKILTTWPTQTWNVLEWSSGPTPAASWWAAHCHAMTTIQSISLKNPNQLETTQTTGNLTIKKRQISSAHQELPLFNLTEINPVFWGGQNSSYIQAIHETNQLYDCIILDGPHIQACYLAALSHLKPNGYLIINGAKATPDRMLIAINLHLLDLTNLEIASDPSKLVMHTYYWQPKQFAK